jgi:hypothetical protein
MADVPGVTPVTTPVADVIVATVVLLLDHVPPGVVLLSVTVLPVHTEVRPDIVLGSGVTVIVVLEIQPPAVPVNLITVVPPDTPVTTPVAGTTVATPGVILLQFPATPPLLSVMVLLTQTVFGPVIGATGLTVIVFPALAVIPHASVTVTVYVVVTVGDTTRGVPTPAPGVQFHVYGGTP